MNERQKLNSEPIYDDEGRMTNCPYELSENQALFVKEIVAQGHVVNYGYSGRSMYGRLCPSVYVEGVADVTTSAKYRWDSLGFGLVVYAER